MKLNREQEAERQDIFNKYGTLEFTRYDPKIAAGKLDKKKWNCPPYRINISCDYIKPLFEQYQKIVSPGIRPIMDAQRYDFECIIMQIAMMDLPPDEKIELAEKEINNIKENIYDYVPCGSKHDRKYPLRARGTIYQGNLKYIDVEPYTSEQYCEMCREMLTAGAGQ